MTQKTQIALVAFSFQSQEVRTFVEDGEIWFNANDVCAILGYSNPRDAIAKHCKAKGVANRDTLTKGGKQSMAYINEPNLYRLIIKSRKPEAEAFEALVMEEVLPSIRKTGKYDGTTSTSPDERTGLRAAVTMLTTKRGLLHSEAYNLVHQRFNVEHIEQIPRDKLPEAVEYVQRMALTGELLPREQPSTAKDDEYTIQHRKFAVRLIKRGLGKYREQIDRLQRTQNALVNLAMKIDGLQKEAEMLLTMMNDATKGYGAVWDGLHESQFHLCFGDEIMKG